jgi:hypothetical protein
LSQYLVRGEQGTKAVDWAQAAGLCREKLAAEASKDPGRVWFVFSPSMTVEEAWLLANFAQKLSPFVKLVMGPVGVVGEDDTYPKDRKGRPVQPVKFTIRAEKAANLRGVQGILNHFQKDRATYQQFLAAAKSGQVDACLIAAAVLYVKSYAEDAPNIDPKYIVQEMAGRANMFGAEAQDWQTLAQNGKGYWVEHLGKVS